MKKFVLAFLILFTSGATWAEPNRLVILGDSLTEGLGVAKQDAFPALLEKKIKALGKNWVVVSSGVSGATTASGPSRMRWNLKTNPKMVILALGANDGLRGLSIEGTEKNLQSTIDIANQAKVKVIIAGMMLPPNYGEDYRKKFQYLYDKIAKKNNLKKIPFLLEGVAGDVKLNQEDGIHPNEKGHAVIAELVFNSIKDLL